MAAASERGLRAQEGTGLARILLRGRFDTLVERRGGGAYWSSVTQDDSDAKEPDLQLQRGMFSTGFHGGNGGVLLDLGDTNLETLLAQPRVAPLVLSEADREKWPLLFSARPAKARASEFLAALPGRDRIEAVAGHTYVLRSILEEEHDVLVAFTVLEADAYGQTLAWRILRTWEPWEGRRGR